MKDIKSLTTQMLVTATMIKLSTPKYGQFNVSIPRDIDSSFTPQLVKKREIYLDAQKILFSHFIPKGMSEQITTSS